MYELDYYESERHATEPVRPQSAFDTVGQVAELSMLIWGEHCIECAIPACYKTCDLYQARSDLRCRRFTYGLYRNPAFSSVRDYGVEVSFKKWGKLETRGNTAMLPTRRVRFFERLWELGVPLVKAFGKAAHVLTRDIRWRFVAVPVSERLCRRLHRRKPKDSRPDAFLLEVYNPSEQPVRMMLEISAARIEIEAGGESISDLPAFTTTIELPSGYSRFSFDHALFSSVTESGLPFDVSLIPQEERVVTLVFLATDFVRYRPQTPAAGAKPGVKCVVWDLDNTIWEGILVEGDDVRVKPDIVDLIQRLDARGILHSIASKNDHGQAWARLEAFGITDYFLHPQINWQPKSNSIRQIATSLNLGLDTFAFVDDNPFELGEVGQALPTVTCISVDSISTLDQDPRFKGSESGDAAQRRKYYQDAIVRESAREESGGDYLRFLASCKIELDIHPFAPGDFDRVCELIQRTNQLNFSGRKYKRDEIQPILDDGGLEKWVLKCRDRFGSYGTVGFGIVRRTPSAVEVEDFMLSCRVQGKFIEQAFFSFLVADSAHAGAERLWVNFHPTDRNKPARQVLESTGLRPMADDAGYELDLNTTSVSCDFIWISSS